MPFNSVQPADIIIIDGSDPGTKDEPGALEGLRSRMSRTSADVIGATRPETAGVRQSSQPFILFMDDDVILEDGCLRNLWNAMVSDTEIGGLSAMISNQMYCEPGLVSRFIFMLMSGQNLKSFAGKVIGPALNLLPEDRPDLPEVVPVDWLNLGCTLYRKEALPFPMFDSVFQGYSVMEDLTLSLKVSQRGWKLANARCARIYHDSQPGDHKRDDVLLNRMELVNRHYVMTRILRRTSTIDYVKLATLEVFSLSSSLYSTRSFRRFWEALKGKKLAVVDLIRGSAGSPNAS